MIKSLSIKNIATFNDDGININDLKQINIIYGALMVQAKAQSVRPLQI